MVTGGGLRHAGPLWQRLVRPDHHSTANTQRSPAEPSYKATHRAAFCRALRHPDAFHLHLQHSSDVIYTRDDDTDVTNRFQTHDFATGQGMSQAKGATHFENYGSRPADKFGCFMGLDILSLFGNDHSWILPEGRPYRQTKPCG